MRMTRKTTTGLCLILTASLAFSQSYSEDFEDGDVSEWGRFWVGEDTIQVVDMSEAPAVLSNGGLKVGYIRDENSSYTGYAQSLVGVVTDKNYIVEADVYVYNYGAASEYKYTGIVAYADSAANYYIKLVADFDADNRLRIYNNHVFAGDPWGYSIDATSLDKTEGWHHMKIQATTNEEDSTVSYRCWYDEIDLGTFVDTSKYRTSSGRAGVFAGANVDGYFDNFVVMPNDGTSIDKYSSRPVTISLSQNFPNPFNPSTTISFDIHEEGLATLSIFNIKGEAVKTLATGYIQPGAYELTWDGTDASGQKVAAGSYLVVLSKGNEQISKNMLLVK
jgi:hypothetical protein